MKSRATSPRRVYPELDHHEHQVDKFRLFAQFSDDDPKCAAEKLFGSILHGRTGKDFYRMLVDDDGFEYLVLAFEMIIDSLNVSSTIRNLTYGWHDSPVHKQLECGIFTAVGLFRFFLSTSRLHKYERTFVFIFYSNS